jgi:hypothetical protein
VWWNARADPRLICAKLRGAVLFDAYDVDGSGTLTPDEVYNIFKASLASKGETISTKEIRDMVRACPTHCPLPDRVWCSSSPPW